MPLIKGKSEHAFVHNIKAEMGAGKPQNQALAIAYATKKRAKKMAQGGEVSALENYAGFVDEHPEYADARPPGSIHSAPDKASFESAAQHDMVNRVMKKYSKGGMVANDVGMSEADELPAEYDDLVLRDDLNSEYTGANSGDELMSEGEEMRRRKMVREAMKLK